MRLGDETAGRWGLALLAATGVAGLILAIHGWSVRGSGLAPGSVAASSRPAPHGRGPQAAPQATAPASGPSSSPRPSASASAGPLLSSEPYASAAFQIWPGRPSAAAQQALTGLKVSVHRQGAGVFVAAGIVGQPLPAGRQYPTGARVYIVESSMGDDSGNTDYSLGDDGLVVTTSAGRIVA
jgi:hypothetical protein